MIEVNIFRVLDDDVSHLCIRNNRLSPLILVKADGTMTWGKSRADKDAIVQAFDPAVDTLLWPWAGEYSTDVFKLSKADLDKHY